MNSWNEQCSIKVITTKGVRDINELRPGDKLYEYHSRETFKVSDIILPDPTRVFLAEYTDGRKELYGLHDMIYLGTGVVYSPAQLIGETFNFERVGNEYDMIKPLGDIQINAFDYHASFVPHPCPDPYIAGALITYGDYSDEYINLPSWTEKVNNLFANKYDVEYAQELPGRDKRYFVFNEFPDKKITWKEMFPNQDFYMSEDHGRVPNIPCNYYQGSIRDRWNYIRGAFDAGYDRTIFPDSVGCAFSSKERLVDLQRMLWSMGIMSKITYLPMEKNGRIFHLEVIGKYSRYPGFFYDPDNIGKILHLQNHTIDQLPLKKLQLKSLTYVGAGVIPVIIAQGWPKLYYSENFIPRISR